MIDCVHMAEDQDTGPHAPLAPGNHVAPFNRFDGEAPLLEHGGAERDNLAYSFQVGAAAVDTGYFHKERQHVIVNLIDRGHGNHLPGGHEKV